MELTREKVLAMDASIQMNVLVAEKVMGWKKGVDFDLEDYRGVARYEPSSMDVRNFSPSTDISAAWEVVNKISKSVSGVELCVNLVTNAVTTGRITVHSDDSMPLAICKAALLSTLTE